MNDNLFVKLVAIGIYAWCVLTNPTWFSFFIFAYLLLLFELIDVILERKKAKAKESWNKRCNDIFNIQKSKKKYVTFRGANKHE